MRRILALLLAIFMVASLCATNIFATEEAGAGTSTEATENTKPAVAVGTAEEFAAMEADGNYYLTANITLTASYPGVFKGTFDGKDFTVTLSAPMFKELEGATIKNLKTAGEIKVTPYYETVAAPTEENPEATESKLVTSYDVAAVACVATDSTFVNIANATTFDATTVAVPTPTDEAPEATTDVNFRYISGIVAYAKGNLTIDGCSNSAAISHDKNIIAGIVAYIAPVDGDAVSITNCANTADIKITDASKKYKAAGIVGYAYEAKKGASGTTIVMDNCVNTGDILGGDQCGGIAGWVRIEDAVLSNCVNEGSVGSTQNYAGGVFGRVGDDYPSEVMTVVKNCVNKGEALAITSQAGGIVGYAASPVYFEGCSNTAKVSFYPENEDGTTSKAVHAGGIIGATSQPVYFQYCTNSGEVTAAGANKAGGIMGNASMTFSMLYCTNTGAVTGGNNAGGLVGHTGADKRRGAYSILFCQSLGDVTGANQVGGLVGYAYGSSRDEFPMVMYNVVNCNVKNTHATAGQTSALIGYFNCPNAVIMYNLVAGTISSTSGVDVQVVCKNNKSVSATLGCNAVLENYTANYALQNGDVETFVGYKAEELVAKANELAGGEYFVKTETGYAVNAFAPAATTEAVAVKTAEEFANMDPLGNYYLDADITLTSTYPIFAGNLDGKGHTVTVTGPVFREIRNGSVSNLVIEGAIAAPAAKANTEADVSAALALTAANCTISGVTNKAPVAGIAAAAGIVARVYGEVTIENCANEGAVNADVMIGGIVAVSYEAFLTVKGTTNSGAIDQETAANEVGGIIGRVAGSRIVLEECVNTAKVSVTAGGARVGGLIGFHNSTFGRLDIINCINTGDVTGRDQVGGLVGWSRAHTFVDGAYNSGSVTSMTNYAAGIICRPDVDHSEYNKLATAYFKNCVNDGTIVAHRQHSAGIVGYSSCNLVFENCYNNGYITCAYPYVPSDNCTDCTTAKDAHSVNAGGILGGSGQDAAFYGCVNTGKIVGNARTGGIVGSLALSDNATLITKTLHGCFNFGDVYSTSANQKGDLANSVGGLVGYANCATNSNKGMDIKNCVVMGEIKAEAGPVGAFVGYANSAISFYENCFFGGTLVANAGQANGHDVTFTYLLHFHNNANWTINYANIKNIYVLDTFNYNYIYERSIGDVATPPEGENLPKNVVTKVSAADLANGTLLATLNANAGEEVFFFNADYDAAPTSHAHSIMSKGDKAPTCVEDGYNAVVSCEICYAVLKAGEVVPAFGHTFPGVATCDNPQYCTTCNAMDSVPHTPGAAATCTETQKCTVCNGELAPALGHAPVQSANSTCQYVKDCSRCGENVQFHYASNKKGTAATCTKDGKTDGQTCMMCGYVIKAQEVIPATGHTSVDVAAVDPTCTKAGATAGKKCSTCNTVLEGCEAVPALGHTEADVEAVAPTCTEAGLTAGKKCSVCEAVLVAQEEVAALGHTEEVLAAVAPTTSATGLTEGKKCSVCDEVLVAQEEVAKLPEETTKAPETTEAPKEGGCGGTIGATVALVAVALLAPAGIMLKKKED